MQFNFSFIIPVFNRPQEILELLTSFTKLIGHYDYEILIIEDGSIQRAKEVVDAFSDILPVYYYFKPNSGPGDSRNFGMKKARGNYFIILDSDCILPSHYLAEVNRALNIDYLDCYGGPDAAHSSFNPIQKAINYVMTSFITTAGIRGNKRSIQKFEPRSFNMGISKQAFTASNGFGKIHPGEDPDLSLRLQQLGFKTGLLENAYVYHKRRITWKSFFNQVVKFGLVRPIITSWHPQSAKITYWLPSLFVIYTLITIVLGFLGNLLVFVPHLLLLLILFTDSAIKNKSVYIGFLSCIALFIQFFGYGIAFLKATFFIRILKQSPQKRFPHLFFS